MAAADELESDAGPGLLLQRERGLERIDAALAAARAGSGRALLIEGPAGSGETTLAGAARRRARAGGMLVLHGRGTELEREYALGVACQCLQPAVQAADPASASGWLSGAAGRAAPVLLEGVAEPDGAAPFAMLHGLYWLVATSSRGHRCCSSSTTRNGSTSRRCASSRSSCAASRSWR